MQAGYENDSVPGKAQSREEKRGEDWNKSQLNTHGAKTVPDEVRFAAPNAAEAALDQNKHTSQLVYSVMSPKKVFLFEFGFRKGHQHGRIMQKCVSYQGNPGYFCSYWLSAAGQCVTQRPDTPTLI